MIIDSEKIDWKWFECAKKVQFLGLLFLNESPNHRKKVISLDILLGNMPRICGLSLDGFFLKFSEPGASPLKKLVTVENLKYLLLIRVDINDLIQIQHVLWLISSSTNLQRLEIWLVRTQTVISNYRKNLNMFDVLDCTESLAAGRVEGYLQLPNFASMILYQLETVVIEGMVGSRSEFHFIKLLLASSPSRKWINFLNGYINDDQEELKILEELTGFPRASTTAQIIWT